AASARSRRRPAAPWRARPGGARRRCRTAGGRRSCGGFYTCRMSAPLALADPPARSDPARLAARIRALARELGFQRCGIAGIELAEDESHLRDWLAQGLYGDMQWMARHGDKRSRPPELVPGTLRVVSVGLDYGR